MNNRIKGNEKEQLAADFLKKNGVRILERNFRNRSGEIDIIGMDGEYLIFIEVKYRSGKSKGYAAEAVGVKKQMQICKVADYYRMIKRVSMDVGIRYDVLAIQGNEIEWIKNAFPHTYTRF